MDKTKLVIGFLLLILTSYGVYISLQNDVRIYVQNDKSTFYVVEDGRWRISGVEYNKLFNGTKLIYRRARNVEIQTLIDDIKETVTIIRKTPFTNGAFIIDTYSFDGKIDSLELFPVSHTLEIINGSGLIYQYEVRKLVYTGETIKDITSPQSFGRNMTVEWDKWNYYSKIYKYVNKDEGKLLVKYRINSDYEKINVRLFDPVSEFWDERWLMRWNITLSGARSSFDGYQPIIEFNTSAPFLWNFSNFNTSGEDFRAVSGNRMIPYAIKEWNSTKGRAVVAFNVTTVCGNMSDCKITIYGNASGVSSNSSFSAVYPNAVVIWDAEETLANRIDNVINLSTTNTSGMFYNTSGKYGNAFSFPESSSGVRNISTNIPSIADFTFILWTYPFDTRDPRKNENHYILHGAGGSHNQYFIGYMNDEGADVVKMEIPDEKILYMNMKDVLANHTWHQFVFRNGTTINATTTSHIDGILDDVIGGNGTGKENFENKTNITFSNNFPLGNYMNGMLDEIMIFSDCKSDDYLYYSYNNPTATIGNKVIFANLTSCTHISQNGRYNLINDLNGNETESCLTLLSNEITIDCKGYSIRGNSSVSDTNYGIFAEQRSGITIRNCNIYNFSVGINFTNVSSSLILNNTIHDMNWTSYNVYLINGSDNEFKNNTIENSTIGVYLDKMDNVTIKNNKLKNNTKSMYLLETNNSDCNNDTIIESSYGFSCDNCHRNLFYDGNYSNNTFYNFNLTNSNYNELRDMDLLHSQYGLIINKSNHTYVKTSEITNSTIVNIHLAGRSLNSTFTNVTLVNESTNYSEGGELIRKWYMDVTVQDNETIFLPDVEVTIYNSTNDLVFNLTTNSSGQVTRQEVIEYIDYLNITTFATNHSINLSVSPDLANCSANSTIHNLTRDNNVHYNATIDCNATNPTNITCEGLTCEDYWCDSILEINCSGSSYFDKILNYTIEAYYDSAWTVATSHFNGTNVSWNMSSVTKQSDVDLRCKASNHTHQSYYHEADVNITIWQEWINLTWNFTLNGDYNTFYENKSNSTVNITTYYLGINASTQYNITPYGQNSTFGIFNITNNPDSTTVADIYVSINETAYNWTIRMGNSSNSNLDITLSTTPTLIYTDLAIGASAMFWNWVDIVNTNQSIWDFKFIFEAEY
jgi:parallel beta-helix repeat protein